MVVWTPLSGDPGWPRAMVVWRAPRGRRVGSGICHNSLEIWNFNLMIPADYPERDPKGGIPSSVVADVRRMVASIWAILSLTPV